MWTEPPSQPWMTLIQIDCFFLGEMQPTSMENQHLIAAIEKATS